MSAQQVMWQPNPQGLAEVMQMLELSHTSKSNAQHREVYDRLNELSNIPDFNAYLVYILAHIPQAQETVRATAGLVLKKNVVAYFHTMSPDVVAYIKSEVVKCIGDPSNVVRSTVAVVIAAVAGRGGLNNWMPLLTGLAGALDSGDQNVVEGALVCFNKLCEDMPGDIDSEAQGRPLDFLIPKWMSFFTHPTDKIRMYALSCINFFILHRATAFLANAEQFVQGIYLLASDAYLPVRRLVCEAMVNLLQVRPDLLLTQMNTIIDYMLHCSGSDDELLALEACEFWSSFAEAEIAKNFIQPVLPALMPVLLKNMIYSDYDLLLLGGDGDDTAEPDRAEDIEPRFHSAKTVGSGEDDDDDDDRYVTEWNLRKSAAAAVDILAGVFKQELLPSILPVIEAALNSNQWDERESAVLALGAIAQGCRDGLEAHLPGLLAHLIQRALVDPKPLVRSIACWTLSRYARWIVSVQPAPEAPDCPQRQLFVMLMEGLLNRVLDRNKQVQEAACSAFAQLEEEACAILTPYLPGILHCLTEAFKIYQVRNLRLLYDAIGCLAECVGDELAKPELLDVLFPPLLVRWQNVSPDSILCAPLMECLNSVATAAKQYTEQVAATLFAGAIALIEHVLKEHANPANVDPPDKDIVVCALDLVSGLVEALGAKTEQFIANTQLMNLLGMCMRDIVPEVRQSAFAVVGDLAKACINQLANCLASFIPILTENLNPQFVSPCNNAGWAVGEIAMQVGPEMRPFVPAMTERLVAIMNMPRVNRNLLENSAITLGRLGLVCPDLVAPHLSSFIHNWCLSLRGIRDDGEKESAFRGLCAMIQLNPQGVADRFILVCDAIASWRVAPNDLQQAFASILFGFKHSLPADQWNGYYSTFPQMLRQVLNEKYNLQDG